MEDPINITLSLLEHTRNRAAVSVLVDALESPVERIRIGAINALARRRNSHGHVAVLRRFPRLSDAEQAALAESMSMSTDHMHRALHDAIINEREELGESACHIILLGRAFDHLPTLVRVAEQPRHRHSDRAAATLIRLTNMLHEELSGNRRQHGCDPIFARRQVLPALEASVQQYGKHKRLEIVDAFLLLVAPNNRVLGKILADPQQPSHKPVIASLRASAVTPIVELLTELLHDTDAPQAALDAIAQRTDRKFLEHMLHEVGSPVSLRVLENMRRMRYVRWLEDGSNVLLELDGEAQAAAVEMASASGIDREQLFSLLKFLLETGQTEARRASCDALTSFPDTEADYLVRSALKDPAAMVRAAAVRQLRDRDMPDAMERLIVFLDDPSAAIRDAARAALSEYSFDRFEALYSSLDDATRRTNGPLVGKVDPTARQRVSQMLGTPSRSIKRRGLEMVIIMRLADEVRDQLAQLLEDGELSIRIEAAKALGLCTQTDVLNALRKAERDPQMQLSEAARRSVDQIADRLGLGAGGGRTTEPAQ